MADIQNGDRRALLKIIQRLVQQLPSYLTVYCFIDGVSSYESQLFDVDGLHDDIGEFASLMQRLVLASQSTRPGFDLFRTSSALQQGYYSERAMSYNLKVLFTSSDGSRLCHAFDQHVILSDGDITSDDFDDSVHSGFESEAGIC